MNYYRCHTSLKDAMIHSYEISIASFIVKGNADLSLIFSCEPWQS